LRGRFCSGKDRGTPTTSWEVLIDSCNRLDHTGTTLVLRAQKMKVKGMTCLRHAKQLSRVLPPCIIIARLFQLNILVLVCSRRTRAWSCPLCRNCRRSRLSSLLHPNYSKRELPPARCSFKTDTNPFTVSGANEHAVPPCYSDYVYYVLCGVPYAVLTNR